jgi:hypothetical protein
VFLLRKPVEVRADGFRVTCIPFMVRYDGQDAYAAFSTTAVAMYFVNAAGLDRAYEAVPLSQTNPNELKEADYALFLLSETQVDRLLAGNMTSSEFVRNLLPLKYDGHSSGDTTWQTMKLL